MSFFRVSVRVGNSHNPFFAPTLPVIFYVNPLTKMQGFQSRSKVQTGLIHVSHLDVRIGVDGITAWSHSLGEGGGGGYFLK